MMSKKAGTASLFLMIADLLKVVSQFHVGGNLLRVDTDNSSLFTVQYLQLKESIRQGFVIIQDTLNSFVDRADALLILLAIAALVDEKMKKKLATYEKLEWPSLQKEFLHTTSAGAEFYQKLDDLLAAPRANALVLQVYLYCLKQDFRGQHLDNPTKINDYIEKLCQLT